MLAAAKPHQCHHKPVKSKEEKKRKIFLKGLTLSFFSSPKTCYELLNIACEESTLGRQKCTLSRES